MEKYLSVLQGFYYFVTGLWPLVSMETFMYVTGPKTDKWLVKTVGVLVTVIGAALINSGIRENINQDEFIIGLGSAMGLMIIDIVYTIKKIISKIYLLDAAAEFLISLIWIYEIYR
jgi:hypothetical protein